MAPLTFTNTGSVIIEPLYSLFLLLNFITGKGGDHNRLPIGTAQFLKRKWKIYLNIDISKGGTGQRQQEQGSCRDWESARIKCTAVYCIGDSRINSYYASILNVL